MNLIKSKIILDKINRLFTSMNLDLDNIAPIEKDLMRDYIKQFYESFLETDEEISVPVTPRKNTASNNYEAPRRRTVEIKATPPPVVKTPPPPMLERSPAPKVVPPKTRVVTPPPPPPVVVEKAPMPKASKPRVVTPPPPPPVVETNIATPKPQPRRSANNIVDPEHTELFEFNVEAKELSEKLGQTRISDLNRAMGVNERIFTINELFGADNTLYRNVIRDLNGMRSFEEAKAYLSANVAERFNWTHKSKRNKAKNFIKLVRRRYL